jgi:hypothetical protein
LLLALLMLGGWFGSVYLTRAHAGSKAEFYVRETTLERLVTVREKGKVVRKLVPLVRRVLVTTPETRYDTKLVTVNGETRVVRQPVVRYVPRVRDRLVTVNGHTQTVSETRLVPTTTVKTRTQTAIVTATQVQIRTDERTVTNTDTQYRTITDTQTLTETSPPVTVTSPPETVTTTETLPPVTVTVLVTTTVKH